MLRKLSRLIARRPAFFGIMAVISVILGLIFIFNTSTRSIESWTTDSSNSNSSDDNRSDSSEVRPGQGVGDGINLPYAARYHDEDGTDDGGLTHVLLNAAVLGALAFAAMNVQPAMYQRVSGTVRAATSEAGIAGFMTVGAATVGTFAYFILSALTLGLLCLALPLVALGWGAISLLLIAGWLAVGYPLGVALAERIRWRSSPAGVAALGTFALTVGHGLLEMIPLFGIFATLVLVAVGSIGLGSLILTRFGRRDYPEVIQLKRKNDESYA